MDIESICCQHEHIRTLTGEIIRVAYGHNGALHPVSVRTRNSIGNSVGTNLKSCRGLTAGLGDILGEKKVRADRYTPDESHNQIYS